MIKLRKLKSEDYPLFRDLYFEENGDYQWIYFDDECKTKAIENDDECFNEFYDIWEKEHNNYNKEVFEEQVADKYYLYYGAEKDSKIIGYLKIFHNQNGIYKIAEWAMLNPNDEEAIAEIFDEMFKLKLPKLKGFWAEISSQKAADIFKKNGFEISKEGRYTCRIQLRKKTK